MGRFLSLARTRKHCNLVCVADHDQPVLFYDADCGICKKSKDLLASWDAKNIIRFEALQSELAKGIGIKGPDYESLVYWRRNRSDQVQLRFSSGTLAALRDIGGLPRILGMLGWLIPLPLRDAAYRAFARNRHRFGDGSCSLD